MMKAGCFVTAVFTFVMCTALMAFADVTGTVTSTSGDPVSGAHVVFINEDDNTRLADITDAGGQYTIGINPVSAGEMVHTAFSLAQNYPNPFNPTTTIAFTLSQSSQVELTIFNVMGQRIRHLVSSELNTGNHWCVWDGFDDSGNHVAAGVYLYRIRAGNYMETKRMLLLDGGSSDAGIAPAHSMSPQPEILPVHKAAVETTYTITVAHDDMIPYHRTNVSVIDGQIIDIELEPLQRDLADMFTMISISEGTFKMGGGVSLAHDVSISAFVMSSCEINQNQYQAVMDANPSFNTKSVLHPVERVSWYDAALFCNRLSLKTGIEPCYDETTWECDFSRNGYRLPTEAEWEYACRAGTVTRFHSGDDISSDGSASTDLDSVAWYWENSWVDGVYGGSHETKPTASKTANTWGLFDMHGNVYEWCNDWYAFDYYEKSPTADPSGPAYDKDYGIITKVIRGGSCMSGATACQSFIRSRNNPDESDGARGFRIVRRP